MFPGAFAFVAPETNITPVNWDSKKDRKQHKKVFFSTYIESRLMFTLQKAYGKKPTLEHIKVFGWTVFLYNDNPRTKIHSEANPAMFMGCEYNGVFTVQIISDKNERTSPRDFR